MKRKEAECAAAGGAGASPEPAAAPASGGEGQRAKRRKGHATAAPIPELRAALAWYKTCVGDVAELELTAEAPPESVSGATEGLGEAEKKALYYHFAAYRVCAALHSHYYAGRCARCWMLGGYCVCARLPAAPLKSEHRVFFVLHPNEFLSGTNSSKLLVRSCPSARFLLQGVEAHEEMLRRMVDDEGDRTILMFPSEDAVDLDQYLAEACGGGGDGDAPPTPEQVRALPGRNIILVDGTWRQAVSLGKRPWLRGARRVKLDFKGKSLFRDLRKRERDVGGGTVEAAIKVLDALGETECADRITEALKLLVDVNKVLKNREPIYGLYTKEEGDAAVHASHRAREERAGTPLAALPAAPPSSSSSSSSSSA